MKDEKRSMIYFLSYLKPHPMGLVLIKDNLGFQVKFDMNTHYWLSLWNFFFFTKYLHEFLQLSIKLNNVLII